MPRACQRRDTRAGIACFEGSARTPRGGFSAFGRAGCQPARALTGFTAGQARSAIALLDPAGPEAGPPPA